MRLIRECVTNLSYAFNNKIFSISLPIVLDVMERVTLYKAPVPLLFLLIYIECFHSLLQYGSMQLTCHMHLIREYATDLSYALNANILYLTPFYVGS